VLNVSDVELNTVLQTVSRQGIRLRSEGELLEHPYDFDWCHHSNVIEVHVSNLRRQLNMDGTLRFLRWKFSLQ
jgi:two-component system response regulator PhoP